MDSGCSSAALEQGEKEWIVRSAVGDADAISRLLLTDRHLVLYKDFISGYTGLLSTFIRINGHILLIFDSSSETRHNFEVLSG